MYDGPIVQTDLGRGQVIGRRTTTLGSEALYKYRIHVFGRGSKFWFWPWEFERCPSTALV